MRGSAPGYHTVGFTPATKSHAGCGANLALQVPLLRLRGTGRARTRRVTARSSGVLRVPGWAQEGSGLGTGCGVNSALTIFESCLFLEAPLTESLPAPQEILWHLISFELSSHLMHFPCRDSSGHQPQRQGRADVLPLRSSRSRGCRRQHPCERQSAFLRGLPWILKFGTNTKIFCPSLQVTGMGGGSRFGFPTLWDAENCFSGEGDLWLPFLAASWQSDLPRGRVICHKCGKMNVKSSSIKMSELTTKSKGRIFQVRHRQAPCKT